MTQIERIQALDYELLSPYIGLKHKIHLKCLKCNKEIFILPESLLRTQRGCRCRWKANKGNRVDIEEIRNRLAEYGVELLSDSYSGKHYPITVKCFCGKIYETKYRNFETNGQTSCGCRQQKYFEKIKNPRIIGEVSKRFMEQYAAQAKRRNIEFDLTAQQIWDLYLKQDKQCVLTGEELVWSPRTQTAADTTISIDRINTKGSYTLDNIRLIHKIINTSKWEFSDDYFYQLCYLICYPMDSQLVTSIIKPPNWLSFTCRIKSKAKERQISYELDNDAIWQLFCTQNSQCSITKQKLIIGVSNNCVGHTASLDRIDNTKPYTLDNVHWVHKDINKIKRTLTMYDLHLWAHKIVDYRNKQEFKHENS